MELTQVISFTLIALLLVISPGPNGVLIAKTVPTSGKHAGFLNVAGFLAAFYFHGALSILGISVLLTQSAELFLMVKTAGAMYLIWLGIKALLNTFKKTNVAKPLQAAPTNKNLFNAFLEGFLTNALNPKVSMFYLAAFPQFIPLGDGAIGFGFVLVSIHAIMNMLWFSAMVVLFARLSKVAKNVTYQKILTGTTGVIFIVFGAKLFSLRTE